MRQDSWIPKEDKVGGCRIPGRRLRGVWEAGPFNTGTVQGTSSEQRLSLLRGLWDFPGVRDLEIV